MAGNKVPTLGTSGWISDVGGKADALFSYFCCSEITQTLVYDGRITSFTHILQKNSADLIALTVALREGLNTYFSPYFDAVNLDIDINEVNNPDNTRLDALTINLTGTVTDDGNVYTLAYLIATNNGKISKFNKLNEGTV